MTRCFLTRFERRFGQTLIDNLRIGVIEPFANLRNVGGDIRRDLLARDVREPGILQSRQSVPPAVAAGQTLVRVHRIGVCGTDIHAFTKPAGNLLE